MTAYFSVIVPVYNAEKTLYACVSSILNQNFTDYEVILVDDGSIDTSLFLCQKLAKQHSFIQLVAQKNAGVSSARNAGLRRAEGKYVAFVDSDDTVKRGWLEALYKTCEETQADIVSYGIENRKENHVLYCNNMYSFVAQGNEELRPHFMQFLQKLVGSVCIKTYSLAMLKKESISFDESIHIFEDSFFDYACLSAQQSISNIDGIFYEYHQYDDSSSHKGRKDILEVGIQKSLKLAECLNAMNYQDMAKSLSKGALEQDIYAHYLQAVLKTVPFTFLERREILKQIFTKKKFRLALLKILKIQPKSISNIIGILFSQLHCASGLALLAVIQRYLFKYFA